MQVKSLLRVCEALEHTVMVVEVMVMVVDMCTCGDVGRVVLNNVSIVN